MREPGAKEAAKIVTYAGGKIVGSTRLQKTACLLELAGAELGFKFSYHLFGPYSEALSVASTDAAALKLIDVKEGRAAWGGRYLTFYSEARLEDGGAETLRQLAAMCADADSVELELAATAAFLAKLGAKSPWEEVASRKKVKATPERLARAKDLYKTFSNLELPAELPKI